MQITFLVSLIIVLSAVFIAIGHFCRGKDQSSEEYFLDNRNLGVVSLTLTLCATQLGGGALIGTANESFRIGIWGILYNLGMCLGFLALGLGLAGKWRNLAVSTTAELLQKNAGSSFLRKMASLFSILSLFGILLGQVVASKNLLNALFPGNQWVLAVIWPVIIFYTFFGGMKAVVYTDILQVLLILLVFGGSFFFFVSPVEVVDLFNIHLTSDTFLSFKNLTSNSSSHTLSFSSLLVLPLLYSLIEQDLAQRFFAAKNQRVAIKAVLITAVVLFCFSLIPVFIGMKAKVMGLTIPEGKSVLFTFFQGRTNPYLLTLLFVGPMLAIVSTADSLLLAISSNMVQDFKIKISPKIVTLVIGIIALVLGFFFENIFEILLKSYALPVVSFFIPFMACLFLKSPSAKALGISSFCGLGSFVLFEVILWRGGGLFLGSEVLAVITSLVAFILSLLIFPRQNLPEQA